MIVIHQAAKAEEMKAASVFERTMCAEGVLGANAYIGEDLRWLVWLFDDLRVNLKYIWELSKRSLNLKGVSFA